VENLLHVARAIHFLALYVVLSLRIYEATSFSVLWSQIARLYSFRSYNAVSISDVIERRRPLRFRGAVVLPKQIKFCPMSTDGLVNLRHFQIW
jgi:hypothetical protein